MNRIFRLVVLLCLFFTKVVQAQITLPFSRMVFQRDNANQAFIPIQGNCPTGNQTIQAKATAINGGTSVDWTTITNASNGTYAGTLQLNGGWYTLEVRSMSGSNQTGYWTLDRVGVGEVFIVSGQSNNMGNFQGTQMRASDDRVQTLNYDYSANGNEIYEQNLPQQFVQASNNVAGPRNPLFLWGGLGDKLVAQLGVPVLFLGATHEGTPTSSWIATANGQEYIRTYDHNAPYHAMGVDLIYYIKRTGMRTVLWHQGESDNYYQTQAGYVANMTGVINKARSQSGLPNMSWMISEVSFIADKFGSEYVNHETDPAIIAAQRQLVAQVSNCFSGIATDAYTGPTYRSDLLHFSDSQYPFLISLWYDKLNPAFFAACQPSIPSSIPNITTGYIFPMTVKGGDQIQVPFMATAPVNSDNVYTVELDDINGNFIANLGAGSRNGNLITVTLPAWADGQLRVRVNSSSPARNGEYSEFFTSTKTADKPAPQAPVLASPYSTYNFIIGQNIGYVNVPANFTDPAGLALIYTWSGLPAGLGANGFTLSGTPNGNAGTYTATLTATNSAGLSANASITFVYSNLVPAGTGLTGDYYNNATLTGTPALSRVEGPIDFFWGESSPAAGVNVDFSVHWHGKIEAPVTGTYLIQTNDDDGAIITIDCQTVINDWTGHGPTIRTGTINLTQGQHIIDYQYVDFGGSAQATLGWMVPTTTQVVDVPKDRLYPDPLTNTNQPPVVANAPATITGIQGTALSGAIPSNTFSDPQGQTLTYSWSGLPAGITATGLTYTGTPATAGNYTAKLTATDNSGLAVSTTVSFAIAAQNNSGGSTTPTTPTAYGRPMGFLDGVDCTHAWGWGADASQPNTSVSVDFYINGTKVGTILANTTRNDVAAAIGGTAARGFNFPIPLQYQTGGNYTITAYLANSQAQLNNVYTASGCPNNAGATTNQPPVVANVPANYTGTKGIAMSVTLDANTFTDPEGQAMTYTWQGLPAGVTGTGLTFSGTPTTIGVYQVALTAFDPYGQSNTTRFAYTVQDISDPAATNKPPVVSNAPGTQNGTVGTALTVNLPLNTITDPENQALTFSWSGLPGGLSANGLSITGTPTTAGTYNATLTATDNGNLSVSTTVTFVIAAQNSGGTTTTYGSPTGFLDSYDCTHVWGWAADRSQPNTSVSVDIFVNGVKAGTVLAANNRSDVAAAIGGTPARGYAFTLPAQFQTAGNHTYTVFMAGSTYQLNNVYTATGCPNNTGATTNQPPIVASAPTAINGTVGTALNGSVPSNTFSDPEGGALTYSWSGLPAGVSASGLNYSGTPTSAGNVNATLTATDNGNLSVSTTVTFVIAAQNNSGGTTPTTYGSPTGFLDSYDCTHVWGWAADLSQPNTSVTVDIYVNGVKAGSALASNTRTDVSAAIGGTSARGYAFTLPAQFQTAGNHTYTVKMGNYQLNNVYTATGCPNNAGSRLGATEAVTVEKGWHVYPNPVASGYQLHVANDDLDPLKSYSVSIVTTGGIRQPIDASQYTVSTGQMDIQMPTLPDGLYILTIASDSGVHTHKVIVGAMR